MAWIVQSFFAAVMLDVVDAIFICYAMDRDAQAVTNLSVHEVFSQVWHGLRCLNLPSMQAMPVCACKV